MSVKEINSSLIRDAIAELCINSNIYINQEIKNAFELSLQNSTHNIEKNVLNTLIKNASIAAEDKIPLCQDTGMAVVFVNIGQDVHVSGDISKAVNDGVEKGYREGYLRKSIVKDPIERVNTNTNTPAVIHYDIVPGDKIHITVAPKGFGSENMSALKMLNPSDGIGGVIGFAMDTVKSAGSNPCPPIIVGMGVGGTMEKAAIMSKQALLRSLHEENDNPYWAGIEKKLLENINKLGIGAGGFGGNTTALAVHINTYPTHIAGLPVAVNIGCHSTRHASVTL